MYLEWITFMIISSGLPPVIIEISNQEAAYKYFQLEEKKKIQSK